MIYFRMLEMYYIYNALGLGDMYEVCVIFFENDLG